MQKNTTRTQQTIDNFHNPIKRHKKDGYWIFRYNDSIGVSNSYISAAIIKTNDRELTIQVEVQGELLIFTASGITDEVTPSSDNKKTAVKNQDAIRDVIISILDHIHDYLTTQPA